MTIEQPIWWDYCVYEIRGSFPVLKGLRKDTPPEIVEAFERDQEMFREAREKGIDL